MAEGFSRRQPLKAYPLPAAFPKSLSEKAIDSKMLILRIS